MNWINEGSTTTPAGFWAGTAACAIKKPGLLDVALLYSEVDCTAAAVFTKNRVVAAPVIVDRQTLEANRERIRAIVANSGNANASTGKPGLENARQMQTVTARALGCDAGQVLVLSTGVIGVQLPMEKVSAGIREASNNLSPEQGSSAARAIMTTDTHAKYRAVKVRLPGGEVTIGGMAKGAGMIHPNMATLLGVFTTDARIAPERLDQMLRTAVDQSFNRITVDGDTSTNDTVILLANGKSQVPVVDQDSLAKFQAALTDICLALAHMIVRDGEGAGKFVEIQVCGAPDDAAAHQVATTIATSPLVKTAFAGSDANWGRILAAAGRAGVDFDQDQAALWIGVQTAKELQLVNHGTPVNYLEVDASKIFSEPEFKIWLDLGNGAGASTIWTSDLTHEYVSINADYRT
ncbi:MAG: bifunctional glutamate N-acetyltransferase/amino-acid acetyltransferase ArgJ [Candidatus Promineifilaceae bacterium]|nr:bifunctional glutamate N-acetyltransferase/amino-acid acetyltransferase ArgJ [Candidatus Promineifilaceae bacterium]